MAIYKLNCIVGVSAYTEVEAETLEEAIDVAEDRGVVLGGVGSGTDCTEDWVIEDADGSPTDIREV